MQLPFARGLSCFNLRAAVREILRILRLDSCNKILHGRSPGETSEHGPQGIDPASDLGTHFQSGQQRLQFIGGMNPRQRHQFIKRLTRLHLFLLRECEVFIGPLDLGGELFKFRLRSAGGT